MPKKNSKKVIKNNKSKNNSKVNKNNKTKNNKSGIVRILECGKKKCSKVKNTKSCMKKHCLKLINNIPISNLKKNKKKIEQTKKKVTYNTYSICA